MFRPGNGSRLLADRVGGHDQACTSSRQGAVQFGHAPDRGGRRSQRNSVPAVVQRKRQARPSPTARSRISRCQPRSGRRPVQAPGEASIYHMQQVCSVLPVRSCVASPTRRLARSMVWARPPTAVTPHGFSHLTLTHRPRSPGEQGIGALGDDPLQRHFADMCVELRAPSDLVIAVLQRRACI